MSIHEKEGDGRQKYSPKHGESGPADALKEPSRDAAGNGGTSGVQSEASTKEADKFLGMTEGSDGINVKTGWNKKTRYTGHHDAG